jgi:hypothetical protein
MVCGVGQVATPDKLSAHVKVTVTGVVFQVLASGPGDVAAVIVGGVLSRFTFAHAVADSPVVSMALPQMD